MTRAAIALDEAPDPRDLRAAQANGMTLVAWRAAGRPVAPDRRQKGVKSSAPQPRPFAPYRSKWELDYSRHLDALKAAGVLVGWSYEPTSFLIGIGARYTPDFLLLFADDHDEWHEVKGYRREAAIVRIKAAALRYPENRFVLVTKIDGRWHHTTIGAAR